MEEFKTAQGNPVGLLSLLSLKDRGRVPDALFSAYAPTLDCIEMLLMYDRTFDAGPSGGTVPAGITGGVPIVNPDAGVWRIPEKELWYIWSASVTFTLNPDPADQLLGPAIAYADTQNLVQYMAMTPYNFLGSSVVGNWAKAHATPRRFFSAGTYFGASWSYANAAFDTGWSLTLEVTKLQL